VPRHEPYTEAGIKRVPCAMCGRPSYAQWNVCADNIDGKPVFRGLCVEHDVGMNELAMRYVFGASREDDLAAYREKVMPNGQTPDSRPPATRRSPRPI
jgi:hypothetical protein